MSVQKVSGSKFAEDQSNKDVIELIIDELKAIRASLGAATSGAGAGILAASTAFNPGDLADGAGETKVITVTGAALGDFVLCSVSADLEDQTLTGYVQAADTVEVRLQNESAAARNSVDLGTLRVLVIPKAAIALPAMVLTKS